MKKYILFIKYMNKGALRKNKLLSPHRPANPDIIRRKPKEQQWSYQHRKQPTKLPESAASLLNDSPNLHSHSSHQSLINGLINDEWIENSGSTVCCLNNYISLP